MNLTASVADTISKYNLIPEGKTVLVAISGGPDSVALLHCLHSLGFSIEAAHLNHQFRGEESDGDALYVADLCRSLGVPLTSVSIDVPQKEIDLHLNAQQAARAVRYEFLEQTRINRRLDYIATAHNSDDRVETVLLNIIRGTGTDGLKGIPFRRNSIIRPLLETPRSSVDEYLTQHNLTSRFDSSNKLPKYSRNSVRAELLPYLEKRFNPSVRGSILRLSQIASDESDYLTDVAAAWIGGRSTLSATQLISEPIALQRRILREWIRCNVRTELADVSHILVEQFRSALTRQSAVTFPGGNFVAESDGVSLTIRELTEAYTFEIADVSLRVGEEKLFGDYLLTVLSISPDVDSETLAARQWKDGDRIILPAGTKKVQDLFTDQKIPRDIRRRYPLITDCNGIVAVGDLRCAARASGTRVKLVKAG
jgi:tRNA(Ile)-lysidine synthase